MEKDATSQQPQKAIVDRNKWRQLVASEYGPKSPTTRLLLHTLGVHMDNNGGSCFPSTKTLSVESGLTERTVCTHLEIASTTGWVEIHQKMGSGRGWKLNFYQAAMPQSVLKEVQHLKQRGTERGSAPQQQGTESDDNKALKEVQSSSSYELISNKRQTFLLKDGTEFIIEDDFFQVLKQGYPKVDLENEFRKIKSWSYSNPQRRKTRKGAERFVNSWMQRAANGSGPLGKPAEQEQEQPKEFDFENQFKCA